jgi:hypothetical protein
MYKEESMEKLLELSPSQIYERIYLWYQTNKDKSKLTSREKKKYLGIIRNLPSPEDASEADISFVCYEVTNGLMKWAAEEKDEYGIKMIDYAKKAMSKLGGDSKIFATAEKSRLAWKYWPIKTAITKALQSLSIEELKQLYASYSEAKTIAATPTQSFLIEKILKSVPSEHLLGHRKLSLVLTSDFEHLYSFFEASILRFDQNELAKLCEELGQAELVKKYKDKHKLLKQLFESVPLNNILQSKVIHKQLGTKKGFKSDVRKIEKKINELSKDIEKLKGESLDTLSMIQSVSRQLEQMFVMQKEITPSLSMKAAPNEIELLKMMREEAISLDKSLSPEKLGQIINKALSQFQTDDLSLTLKGLELLFLHYFLTKIRDMQWKPDFEEFLKTIREEIPKIQILPNQAEIPMLREKVSQRLGISELTFDEQLIEAWKKGYVKLDVGAPIGREDVKYLKYGQSSFFYVKLLRG